MTLFSAYAPSPPPPSQRARNDGQAAKTKLEIMQVDIERLLMISEALWDMLREQHGYSEDDLINRIAEIDMRDGQLDGRVAPAAPLQCPNCHKTLMKKRPVCLYCGTPVALNPFDR